MPCGQGRSIQKHGVQESRWRYREGGATGQAEALGWGSRQPGAKPALGGRVGVRMQTHSCLWQMLYPLPSGVFTARILSVAGGIRHWDGAVGGRALLVAKCRVAGRT
ncbi:hypothetical protein NDU88_003161 [Pleurodeles waltl]|uniref:Uncharacterized protein n=1 Tax=Pleurodeles waltl TaxID=8319 RepID=A0AAV7Q884_PLEWA|nr:hypothetical protein NDU88_003161 [Pleurodeles waltl]